MFSSSSPLGLFQEGLQLDLQSNHRLLVNLPQWAWSPMPETLRNLFGRGSGLGLSIEDEVPQETGNSVALSRTSSTLWCLGAFWEIVSGVGGLMVAESKRSREEEPLAKAEETPEGSPRISIREVIPSVGRPRPSHIQLMHSRLRISLGICSWRM